MQNQGLFGIYGIRHIVSGHTYVGQSENITKRWITHKTLLHKNNHSNKHLQNAWNRYGEESFEFVILEDCSLEICGVRIIDSAYLTFREQDWANCLRPKIYNTGTFVDNPQRGVKASPETLEKLSASKSGKNHPCFGKPQSEEHRRHISEANSGEKGFWFGKNLSEETRTKISISHTGKKRSVESIQKGANTRRRYKHSPEAKVKMSKAQIGRPPTFLGKTHSESTRKKMSDASKGKPKSEETRRKLSESLIKFYQLKCK